ncbi:YadA C-terminal domain-containing protein, partial [Proteus mirabilis]
DSHLRTDRLISREQKARIDALNAEKLAREQGDANTLTSANQYTDKKVSESNTRTDSLISKEQKARTDVLNAEKLAREQGDANTLTSANQYTDKKVSESNTRTDSLISKEQKARTDALNTEKTVREQADINTLKNANQYTDLKIQENNELLSADIEQARSDFDDNLKTTKAALENNISDVNRSLTNSVNRAKKYLSDNLDKTRHDLSASIIASQNDSHLRTDRLISREQKARIDALNAEKTAREQGDVTTLNNANKYTDHRIRSLGLNVSDALNDFQQKTDQKFAHLDNKIGRVEKRANAGIAGVTAISTIPYVNSERFSFGMAMGHYRDAQAIATGMQYKPTASTNVRLNASWNTGGDTSIGAGFAVGW